MEQTELLKILHGDIAMIERVNHSDIALYGLRVVVTPDDVKNLLERYLSGKLTSKQLILWAKFLCLRTEYVSPECDDANPDYYEDMWYVVQCLSTPEIDGEVNQKQVSLYLTELNKYFI